MLKKEKYHHGDLKAELLKNGLHLLNKEGYEGFSLRKVAALCNVSHSAPYKHFSSKDELIATITADVSESFISTLAEVMKNPSTDPKSQIIEVGLQYIKFLIEHPDYFKFIFLTNHHNPILMTEDTFITRDGHPFQMIQKCMADFLSSVGMEKKNWVAETLSVWGLVHGLVVLHIHNTIAYTGDYMELAEKLLRERLAE